MNLIIYWKALNLDELDLLNADILGLKKFDIQYIAYVFIKVYFLFIILVFYLLHDVDRLTCIQKLSRCLFHFQLEKSDTI